MDTLFLYLFTVLSVTFLVPIIEGTNTAQSALSKGLAVSSREPDIIVSQKGASLLLNCSVDYDEELGPLTFSWEKDGSPVELSRRVQVLENGSLYLRRILHRPKKETSDEGRYKCFARLEKVGTVIARDVKVHVAGIGRKFDIEPQPVTAPVGGVARFQCLIQGVPPVLYIWYRNKTLLPQNDNRYLTLDSGILQITGVLESDAGLYRCYATQGSFNKQPGEVQDVDGRHSEEAALTVVTGSPPSQAKIVASSQNVTAIVRTQAILECLVQGFSGQVEWQRNGKVVQTGPRIQRAGNNLILLETELTDNGKYECRAANVIATMQLHVIKKPVITEITESQRTQKATWVYLDCLVEGHPAPKVTWLKDGQEVKYDIHLSNRSGNQLVIVQSEILHSGFYQCVASNEAGTVSAFTRLEVFMKDNVPYPPTNLTAVEVTSHSIYIEWQPPAQGPMAFAYSIHWQGPPKGSDVVTQNTRFDLTNLWPFSNYTIYVIPFSSTGAGRRSEDIVVRTLEALPVRAPAISLKAGPGSVDVTWSKMLPEHRNGIILTYRVYYREKGTLNTENIQDNIPATESHFLITGLLPETEYEVRALAANSIGYPTLSEDRWPWVSVKTEGDHYIVAPELQLEALNMTAMKVSWSVASVYNVQQFKLEIHHLESKTTVQSHDLPASVRSYVFAELDTEADYEVILIVTTSDGTQAESSREISLSGVPQPVVPSNLRVALRDVESLSVEWDVLPFSLAEGLEVTSFTVKYTKLDDNGDLGAESTANSNINSVLLEGLQPFTKYEIAVRSNSVGMSGRYCKPITAQTLEGVPSEPRNIQIQPMSQDSVSVTWTPPAHPNGEIKFYTIYYTNMPKGAGDVWLQVNKSGTENSAVIKFSDDTKKVYYFKLQASTAKGPGKETMLIPVDPTFVQEPDESTGSSDQQLGILIGVGIGVVCIIICVIIILLRHRCIRSAGNLQPQTQPARFHGNGHLPGNGHAHLIAAGHDTRGCLAQSGNADHGNNGGIYEMETYTPMLSGSGRQLSQDHHVYTPMMENEHSDSKGGGSGNIILTPNGAKLNGFVPLKNGVKNGQLHNGHVPAYLPSQYRDQHVDVEERRGLIAAMLGGRDTCMGITDDSLNNSHYEDLGSLDGIDKNSSNEAVDDLHVRAARRRKGVDINCEDSGEGSLSHSSSERNSTGYVGSMHVSDTTDTGDTVIFCGESGISGMSVGMDVDQRSASNDGLCCAEDLDDCRGDVDSDEGGGYERFCDGDIVSGRGTSGDGSNDGVCVGGGNYRGGERRNAGSRVECESEPNSGTSVNNGQSERIPQQFIARQLDNNNTTNIPQLRSASSGFTSPPVQGREPVSPGPESTELYGVQVHDRTSNVDDSGVNNCASLATSSPNISSTSPALFSQHYNPTSSFVSNHLATPRSLSGTFLPQNQLSTSNVSQANKDSSSSNGLTKKASIANDFGHVSSSTSQGHQVDNMAGEGCPIVTAYPTGVAGSYGNSGNYSNWNGPVEAGSGPDASRVPTSAPMTSLPQQQHQRRRHPASPNGNGVPPQFHFQQSGVNHGRQNARAENQGPSSHSPAVDAISNPSYSSSTGSSVCQNVGYNTSNIINSPQGNDEFGCASLSNGQVGRGLVRNVTRDVERTPVNLPPGDYVDYNTSVLNDVSAISLLPQVSHQSGKSSSQKNHY